MKKLETILIGCFVLGLSNVAVSADTKHSNHNADQTEEHQEHQEHQAHNVHKKKHTHGHAHAKIDVSTFANQPTVALQVTKDEGSGWNIQVQTTHFEFAPEQVNQDAVEGRGHAHLYVDDKKITRLYGHWYHLGELEPGAHTVRVTLNANNHADLVLGDKNVEATFEIVEGT